MFLVSETVQLGCNIRLMAAAMVLWLLLSAIVIEAHAPHDDINALTSSKDGKVVFVIARKVLFRSTDYGATFQYVPFHLPAYNPRLNVMSISPYHDETLYIYHEGTLWRSSSSEKSGAFWEGMSSSPYRISPCEKHHYKNLKRRMTFNSDGGALIVGSGGKMYKENTANGKFDVYTHKMLPTCGAIAAVYGTDTVYAAGNGGSLMRSMDGGETFAPTTIPTPGFEIIHLISSLWDKKVFIITAKGICYIDHDDKNPTCTDVNLPDTTHLERVRTGGSPPTDLTYNDDGILVVTRANSYAVYYTADLGATWHYKSFLDGDFPTDGHIGGDVGWDFAGVEEFTHVDGRYLGTWRGVFVMEYDEKGEPDWKYRNTIRYAITTFFLVKDGDSSDDGVNFDNFKVSLCTYSAGCFLGPPTNPAVFPVDDFPGSSRSKPFYYPFIALSPNYSRDGIAFQRSAGWELRRLDEGRTKVSIPRIAGDGGSLRIKGVVYSPKYEFDNTIFLFGQNIGVVASYDKGLTFYRRIFDGDGFPWVNKLVLSPGYPTDGTMACLIDPNFDGDGWSFDDDQIAYIYVTQNHGDSWRRIVWTGQTFRDIIIVAGDDSNAAPILVALFSDGKMYAHTTDLDQGWFPFKWVSGTSFPTIRPRNFANDGLAVSPDGGLLAAAFAEGGTIFGRIRLHAIEEDYFANPSPYEPNPDLLSTVFGRYPPLVPDVQGRTFTSHIQFSPEFATDGTIFAVDMFSVFVSTNRGVDWKKLYTLGPH